MFAKSDLKDGDIVTYRDGRIRTLRDECMIDEDGYIGLDLDDYNVK
ncbi:MAG: hypothetical protein HFJ30_00365 [Clostridia bacterium]|jgi:hypothetical protein|nr:hypothetical protein [Clostridia bacterium]